MAKRIISLKKPGEDYSAGPLFLYIYCKDDELDPISIDVNDRNLLLLAAGNKELLYKFFATMLDDQPLPPKEQIDYVNIDLYDNEEDALSSGNDDLDVWNFDSQTQEINWASYDPNEWDHSDRNDEELDEELD